MFLLQSQLASVGSGVFTYGNLPSTTLDVRMRERIDSRVLVSSLEANTFIYGDVDCIVGLAL